MSPLRRRMIEDMQIRNLTVNTQRVYVAQVVQFACHFRKSPDLLGPAEIRTYLIHLTRERHLAASSVIVAVSALRFFYTVTLKRPWVVADDIPAGRQAKKLPIVLSQDEVACVATKTPRYAEELLEERPSRSVAVSRSLARPADLSAQHQSYLPGGEPAVRYRQTSRAAFSAPRIRRSPA